MKLAFLGDIQANLPALEAVIQHAKSHGVTAFFNVGNSLGFDSFPNETIQKLKSENILSILGSFEHQVLTVKTNLAKLKKSASPDHWILLNWIYDNLTGDSLDYLKSMPTTALITVQKKPILLLSQPPKLTKFCSQMRKLKLAELPPETMPKLVIYSKQQFPFVKKINNIRFINTGAVGYAFDTDIWACYTVLHFAFGLLRIQQFRIKYQQNLRQFKIWPTEFSQLMALTSRYQTESQISGTLEPSCKPVLASTEVATNDSYLKSVEQLLFNCLNCKYAIIHTNQVTRLALELFEQLQFLHKLGKEERSLLCYGALLHDIGWLNGQKGHHKVAFNIISNTETLPLKKRERFIIALLALYHRKNTPAMHHLHFASLQPADRQIVSYLTAILRVADAFDVSHQNLVDHLMCRITTKIITINYFSRQPLGAENLAVMEKGQFLAEIFHRKLVIEWKTV